MSLLINGLIKQKINKIGVGLVEILIIERRNDNEIWITIQNKCKKLLLVKLQM